SEAVMCSISLLAKILWPTSYGQTLRFKPCLDDPRKSSRQTSFHRVFTAPVRPLGGSRGSHRREHLARDRQ
ncbi:MAG TPA: hypothetical protein VG815_16270, partial [Chloroflexota bacterium]|nr:hypothetical protein [Chloroflexota bacterium]